MVTKLVLLKDRDQSVILFVTPLINFGDCGEVHQIRQTAEEGAAKEETTIAVLNT